MKKKVLALVLFGLMLIEPVMSVFAGEAETADSVIQETIDETETADSAETEAPAEAVEEAETEAPTEAVEEAETEEPAETEEDPLAIQNEADLAMAQELSENIRADYGAEAKVYVHNGKVTLIDGACTDQTIGSMEEASELIRDLIFIVGGNEETQFEPWREVTDPFDNHYYIFQQMYNDITVLGGALKVITDSEGTMTGLSCSVETELPEEEEQDRITAKEAEQLVLEHGLETMKADLKVIEGQTSLTVLSMLDPAKISDDTEMDERSRYAWVVFTDNPENRMDASAELPYLAHYVTASGEYLYSLPTIMPGDEAGSTGSDASYVFEFMEPVDYTGYVDLQDGTEKEITVTVMRDKRTGMYYLGNIERRIVVADCYEFLYNDGQVVLESSPDNQEWDQVGLVSLYNYCRAWDYYNAIGWSGGDGLRTPMLILNNFCDENHNPIDNACYAGALLGWQVYLASQGNDFSQCLDILAHEFTHCVTGSVMTYNAYYNDFGAINEAMSDIQGQTCQMMMEGDDTWIMGDQSSAPVRSMSDPNRKQQPAYTWDYYYKAGVQTPTDVNDRGGVHANSSILNHLAYLLYEEGGMTLEEGRAFWFAADCAMVPGTDYRQLAELLPWLLRVTGLEKYQDVLASAIETVRMGRDEFPETLDPDRTLLTLTLPDNEIFTDGNWALEIISVDFENLFARISEIMESLKAGDYSVLPEGMRKAVEAEEERKARKPSITEFVGGLIDDFFNDDEEQGVTEAETETKTETETESETEVDETEADTEISETEQLEQLSEWLRDNFGRFIYMDMVSAGQDGRTIQMVGTPGRTIPILMHMSVNMSEGKAEQVAYVIYFNGKWYDISSIASPSADPEKLMDSLTETPIYQDLLGIVTEKFMQGSGFSGLYEALTYKIEGGTISEIPSAGLEEVTLDSSFTIDNLLGEVTAEPKKSRPKLAETEAESETETAATEEPAEKETAETEEPAETETAGTEAAVTEEAETETTDTND